MEYLIRKLVSAKKALKNLKNVATTFKDFNDMVGDNLTPDDKELFNALLNKYWKDTDELEGVLHDDNCYCSGCHGSFSREDYEYVPSWEDRFDLMYEKNRLKHLLFLVKNPKEIFEVSKSAIKYIKKFEPTKAEIDLLKSMDDDYKQYFNGSWIQEYMGVVDFVYKNYDEAVKKAKRLLATHALFDIYGNICKNHTKESEEKFVQLYVALDKKKKELRHNYTGIYDSSSINFEPTIVGVLNDDKVAIDFEFSWSLDDMKIPEDYRDIIKVCMILFKPGTEEFKEEWRKISIENELVAKDDRYIRSVGKKSIGDLLKSFCTEHGLTRTVTGQNGYKTYVISLK